MLHVSQGSHRLGILGLQLAAIGHVVASDQLQEAVSHHRSCEADDVASLLQSSSPVITSSHTDMSSTARTRIFSEAAASRDASPRHSIHHPAHSSAQDSWIAVVDLLSSGEDLHLPWDGRQSHGSSTPAVPVHQLQLSDHYALAGMCIVMCLALCLNFSRAQNVAVLTLVTLWVTSSVSMNIVNKIALKVLPLPMTLLIVQMVIAVVLLFALCGPLQLLKEIRAHPDEAAQWSLLTFFFAAGLITSILALDAGSVTFLLILRNVMPLLSLLLERQLLPVDSTRPVTLEAICALATLAFGTVIYATFNLRISHTWNSLGWVILNMVVMVMYRLAERRLLLDMPRSLSFGALNLLQNTCGLLPVVALFFAWGEHRALWEHVDLFQLGHWRDPMAMICIVFSGCSGLALGYYSTKLQKEITATTMLALQSLMKVFIIFLAMVTLGEHFFSSWGAIGCIISILGGAWYALVTSRPESPPAAYQTKP